MGYLGQGIDSRGHVISYGGGDLDEEDLKVKPLNNDTHIGPMREVDPHSGILKIPAALNAWIRRDAPTLSKQNILRTGSGHTYPLEGDARNSHAENPSVFLNGVQLDDRDYTIDVFSKKITIHKYITDAADDIEVRFAPDINKYYLIDNLLILPVSDAIPEEDLHMYAPDFGDKINIERIMRYKENHRDSVIEIIGPYDLEPDGLVMNYEIKPTGIYATLKLR